MRWQAIPTDMKLNEALSEDWSSGLGGLTTLPLEGKDYEKVHLDLHRYAARCPGI
jgi:hypothetical protein